MVFTSFLSSIFHVWFWFEPWPKSGVSIYVEAAGKDPAVQLLHDEQQHRKRLLPRRHAGHGVREGEDNERHFRATAKSR